MWVRDGLPLIPKKLHTHYWELVGTLVNTIERTKASTDIWGLQ